MGLSLTPLHLYPAELEAQVPGDGSGNELQAILAVSILVVGSVQFHQKLYRIVPVAVPDTVAVNIELMEPVPEEGLAVNETARVDDWAYTTLDALYENKKTTYTVIIKNKKRTFFKLILSTMVI